VNVRTRSDIITMVLCVLALLAGWAVTVAWLLDF
jgi:hypothetical protein